MTGAPFFWFETIPRSCGNTLDALCCTQTSHRIGLSMIAFSFLATAVQDDLETLQRCRSATLYGITGGINLLDHHRFEAHDITLAIDMISQERIRVENQHSAIGQGTLDVDLHRSVERISCYVEETGKHSHLDLMRFVQCPDLDN